MKTKDSEQTRTSGPKLWVVLARAYGALAAFVESRVAAEGLCLSDFMVLEVLLHKGPMHISGIGEKVLLANASMTSAVDRLEKRAFVVRGSSATDRRARIVALTEAGHAFISELYARHASEIEGLMTDLSGRERNELRASLKKLGRAADAALEHADPLAPLAPRTTSTTAASSTRRKG